MWVRAGAIRRIRPYGLRHARSTAPQPDGDARADAKLTYRVSRDRHVDAVSSCIRSPRSSIREACAARSTFSLRRRVVADKAPGCRRGARRVKDIRTQSCCLPPCQARCGTGPDPSRVPGGRPCLPSLLTAEQHLRGPGNTFALRVPYAGPAYSSTAPPTRGRGLGGGLVGDHRDGDGRRTANGVPFPGQRIGRHAGRVHDSIECEAQRGGES
jgi:hypothetical protein